MRLLLEKLLDILEAVLRFRHRRNGKAGKGLAYLKKRYETE